MPDRAQLLGCSIDRLDMHGTIALCDQLIEARGEPVQHVSVNVAKLMLMRRDPRLREVIGRCAIVNPDGQPLVWASRLLRDPLPERVAGYDLMHKLLERAELRAWRVYFLGARQEILDRALTRLHEVYPDLRVCGSHHGYFDDDTEGWAVREDIRRSSPDVLFVAMSSPRKEYWLGQHLPELGVPLGIGVGGSIDIVAGLFRRAPYWVQRSGLEWLFRLAQEPRRLARRYLVTNTGFLAVLGTAVVRTHVLRKPG